MEEKKLTIAIDGPVGSGKGTLATALAKKLNALYLYTGGMYRALTLACIDKGIDPKDENAVLNTLNDISIELDVHEPGTKIFLDGKDISERVFLPDVGNTVPIVAAHAKVREEMVRRQKKLIRDKTSVVEGRDITTVVAPDAEMKIYLTADSEVRAKRRHEQFVTRGINKTYEEVLSDTKERDRHDTERDASPMYVPQDAVTIDTTNDTVDETIEKVIKLLNERNLL